MLVAGKCALANAAGEYETEAEAIAFVLESKKAFGPFTEEAAHKFAWIASQDHRMESGVCIMIL